MWRAITEADILSKMSSAELEAFREAAVSSDQDDPITSAITNVTGLVRGYVASNASNTLDTETDTVPERLIPAAVDVLVVDIPARAAGTQIDPDSARAKAKDKAIKLFEQVAADKFSIEDPITGTESAGGGARRVTRNIPRVNRRNMRGF